MRRAAFGAAFDAACLGRLWVAASLSAILASAAGCGPIEYIANVPGDASGAIAEAKHVGADKYAPYEITAAEQYIHKARHLAGYARFQSAGEFGKKAGDNARKATKIAKEKAALPATDDATPTPSAPTAPAEAAPPAAEAPSAPPPQKVVVTPAPAPVEVKTTEPSKVIVVPAPATPEAPTK